MSEPLSLQAPTGGMRLNANQWNMPANYSPFLLNTVSRNGQLNFRAPLNAELTETNATTIYRWGGVYTKGTTSHLVIVPKSGSTFTVKRYNGVSWSTIHTLASNPTQSVSFNFLGYLITTFYGSTGPREYDGTTSSAVSFTLPGAGDWATLNATDITGGIPFKGRVFY